MLDLLHLGHLAAAVILSNLQLQVQVQVQVQVQLGGERRNNISLSVQYVV